MICETLAAGNKILLCGNGGSAADAQHIAAELVGRYEQHRRSFRQSRLLPTLRRLPRSATIMVTRKFSRGRWLGLASPAIC